MTEGNTLPPPPHFLGRVTRVSPGTGGAETITPPTTAAAAVRAADGRGHHQPGYPHTESGFRAAHPKSEAKSVSDPFKPPPFFFVGGMEETPPPPPSAGSRGADASLCPGGLRGGDWDLQTFGVPPLYPAPIPHQG